VRLGRKITRAFMLALIPVGLGLVLGPRAVRRRVAPAPKIRARPVFHSVAQRLPSLPFAPPQSIAPPNAALCPDGMLLIDGQYCPELAFRCLKYLGEGRLRCAEFAQTRRCVGKLQRKKFCIDQYEYPNREAAKPRLAVTWEEAGQLCREQGKRLCASSEWTLACEGPEPLPYPYGFKRDATLCNVDKPYRFPDNDAYANPRTRAQEVARLDQRERSGSRPGCVSPYGVYDLTGNVDEWVVNEKGSRTKPPYVSGLKGGYWGPVRNRCRPITDVHNMWHSGYQIGFRCCTDAPAEVPPRCDPARRQSTGPECPSI